MANDKLIRKLNEALELTQSTEEARIVEGAIEAVEALQHYGPAIVRAYCPTCCGHCDVFEKCVTRGFRAWCKASGIDFQYIRDDAKFIQAKKKYKLGNALVPVLLQLDEDGGKLAQASFREGQDINGYTVPPESGWCPEALEEAVEAFIEG